MKAKNPNILGVLTESMSHSNARQKVIAQNIANVDVPHYKTKDLKPFTIRDTKPHIKLKTTSPLHLSSSKKQSKFSVIKEKNLENSPNENNVSLENEMVKVTETNNDYNLALSSFKQLSGLLKHATSR